MFVAIVFQLRHRSQDSASQQACLLPQSDTPGATRSWLVAVIRSRLLDVPQIITAAMVVATFQPLSVLVGCLVGLASCVILALTAPLPLRVASRLAQRSGALVFALAGVAVVIVGAAAAGEIGS